MIENEIKQREINKIEENLLLIKTLNYHHIRIKVENINFTYNFGEYKRTNYIDIMQNYIQIKVLNKHLPLEKSYDIFIKEILPTITLLDLYYINFCLMKTYNERN
jgi:hypothetical protein